MSLEHTDLITAQIYKPHLRFPVGTTVFLKSDLKRKSPLTITFLLYDSDQFDYRTSHFNSQKVEEIGCFLDATLTI